MQLPFHHNKVAVVISTPVKTGGEIFPYQPPLHPRFLGRRLGMTLWGRLAGLVACSETHPARRMPDLANPVATGRRSLIFL